MYLVESKGGAIVCMLVALVLLGTWPAILALLQRRGRLPQHTYLDYSFTNFLTAVIIALTLGQIGEAKPLMPNFLSQLSQNNWPSVLIAMAGGVFLSLGKLSTLYSWAFVGLSVTEVISSGIAVVLGIGCFLIAVCLGIGCFYFLLSFFAIAIVLNVVFLYHPILNLPKSCSELKLYLKDWNGRNLAFFCQFLVWTWQWAAVHWRPSCRLCSSCLCSGSSTYEHIWGMVFFGEYRRSSPRTNVLLGSLLFMFIVAVAVLIASSGHRKA